MIKHWKTLAGIPAAALLLGFGSWVRPAPRLVWNASASVPVGLYSVSSATTAQRSDVVVVMPPEPLASYLADRGYLPHGVPLLKRLAATPGQTVCRDGAFIIIDGITVAEARRADSHGRPLPAWRGCRTLHDGQAFLLNADVQDSFDGRYFGPLTASAIVGRATPIWTRGGQ